MHFFQRMVRFIMLCFCPLTAFCVCLYLLLPYQGLLAVQTNIHPVLRGHPRCSRQHHVKNAYIHSSSRLIDEAAAALLFKLFFIYCYILWWLFALLLRGKKGPRLCIPQPRRSSGLRCGWYNIVVAVIIAIIVFLVKTQIHLDCLIIKVWDQLDMTAIGGYAKSTCR